MTKLQDIKISDEMLKAGADALYDFDDDTFGHMPSALVELIAKVAFEAMQVRHYEGLAKPKKQTCAERQDRL